MLRAWVPNMPLGSAHFHIPLASGRHRMARVLERQHMGLSLLPELAHWG